MRLAQIRLSLSRHAKLKVLTNTHLRAWQISYILEINNMKTLTPDEIIQQVCRKYRVSKRSLVDFKRGPRIDGARTEAMFRIRNEARTRFTNKPYTLSRVGKLFNRDHSTVSVACKRFNSVTSS